MVDQDTRHNQRVGLLPEVGPLILWLVKLLHESPRELRRDPSIVSQQGKICPDAFPLA